jgi:hypothetical protein
MVMSSVSVDGVAYAGLAADPPVIGVAVSIAHPSVSLLSGGVIEAFHGLAVR